MGKGKEKIRNKVIIKILVGRNVVEKCVPVRNKNVNEMRVWVY